MCIVEDHRKGRSSWCPPLYSELMGNVRVKGGFGWIDPVLDLYPFAAHEDFVEVVFKIEGI
jgi:hypothetical protein